MQRKTKILIPIFILCIMASAVTAAFVANYIIPSQVLITASPGITVYNASDQPIMTLDWGDVQRGMSKDFQIKVKNTDGEITLYIIDASLVHNLPMDVGTLTWNFASLYGAPYLPYAMNPGGGSGPGDGLITLHLTISPTAPEGTTNFQITINAFSSASG